MRRTPWPWIAVALVAVLLVGGVAFALGRSSASSADTSGPARTTEPGATTTVAEPDAPETTGAAATDTTESPVAASPDVTTSTPTTAPGTTTAPTAPADGFLETFDGAPDAPEPWRPDDWDVTVHSRDVATWEQLEPMQAQHTATCGSPGSHGEGVHEMSSYDDAVFRCRDHVMTSLLASGYGLIYLTPAQVLDFSSGTATIRFDMSTLRTAGRDWWSVWITPYDEQLQLPLESWLPDLSGPPRDSVQIRLDSTNLVMAEIFDEFTNVEFDSYPYERVPGDWSTTYDSFLTPDASRRDTFEIQISRTHLKVGMPAYDFWWIDTDIPELAFSSGIVQFGHHSYNPEKDCGDTNPPGWDGVCKPNTWHWDNVSLSPSTPFAMLHPDRRVATAADDTLTFDGGAPADAHLRFAGAGGAPIEVSYDGGPWQAAEMQDTEEGFVEGVFQSYWTPVPAGTTTVSFRGASWYGGDWRVRDASIWAAPEPTTS